MKTAPNISKWFLWWALYSFIGWAYETTLAFFDPGPWNGLGFLYGPWRPIYGTGALLVLLLLYGRIKNVAILFLAGSVVATALEYATSVVIEQLFGVRLWDYSDFRFNLDGRISLLGAVIFGVLFVLLVRFVHPRVEKLTDKIGDKKKVLLAAIIAGIVAIDLCITVIIHLTQG